MKLTRFMIPLVALSVLSLPMCTYIDEPEVAPPVVVAEGDTIFIVDLTGKAWDITYAVENFGMRPDVFKNGLGPDAIRPLITPKMVSPGEIGFPDPGMTFIVIGEVVAGEARAYKISDLTPHEVVDETVADPAGGEIHLAVGW